MRLGLRAKSILALLGSVFFVLALSIVAGWRVVEYIEGNLGSAYARNITQLNRQRILTPILRELALSQQFARSRVMLSWLQDEKNPIKRESFFQEAGQYQKSFGDHSYFVITRDSRHYYFNDYESMYSDKPRYSLHDNDPDDAWFFTTMKSRAKFNINVNLDTKLKVTKVWFNILVKDSEGRNIGLAGTGLALNSFLDKFINSHDKGVTPIIINATGDIQAYPDPTLIDYSSVDDKGGNHSTVYQLLKGDSDARAIRQAIAKAQKNASDVPVFWANLNGSRKLLAIASVPELNWFVITAVDLHAAHVLDNGIWLPVFFTGMALLVLLVLTVMIVVNKILLKPVLELTASVQTVAAGNYEAQLPSESNDELGQLTKAFASMLRQVKSHTTELEDRVAERTRELMGVNQKIDDSIQYARLIQNAILPGREMDNVLKENYFVLWQPRDIVGGDFYIFRSSQQGCLLGVIDCAGHGVPGAFMTMIAHSVLDVVIETLGIADPASLLSSLDERFRAILQEEIQETPIATHLDAGLVYIDYVRQTATFSGAKNSLYYCADSQVNEVKGSRYAIGGKRANHFVNQEVKAVSGVTFYFSTDGLLDQAGGNRGYGFGSRRFTQFLRDNCHLPFSEQRKVLLEELRKYQGSLPRRDDITVLGFRIKIPREIT